MHVLNAGYQSTTIEFSQKLVQAVPIKIDCGEYSVEYEKYKSTEEFYKDHNHSRGDGGFGSTGLK